MQAIRSIILCGCTAEKGRCAFKSWHAGAGCKCACHFTQEQTQQLISAYIALMPDQLAGFMKGRMKEKQKSLPGERTLVTYSCGHEILLDWKPSSMARQYMQQNPCDDCREK